MVIEISKETESEILNDFLKHFQNKINKKGRKSFNSPWECCGKMFIEEKHECEIELHKKDWDRLSEELFDVAVCAIFGVMSIEENRKLK